jgi:hypothetical protein
MTIIRSLAAQGFQSATPRETGRQMLLPLSQNMAAISGTHFYHCLKGSCTNKVGVFLKCLLTGFFVLPSCSYEVKLFREASEGPALNCNMIQRSLESVMEIVCQIRQRVFFSKYT